MPIPSRLLFFNLSKNVLPQRFMFYNQTMQMKISSRGYSSDSDEVKKLDKKIGFIGDGNMAKAIAKAIVRKNLIDYNQIHVSSPFFKNLEKWKTAGANIYTDNGRVAEEANIIFLAVKPNVFRTAIDSIKNVSSKMDNKLFVSIMVGMPLSVLEETLSKFKGVRVIRCMPNTPMMVGEGVSVYTAGHNVTQEDLKIVGAMLNLAGVAEQVPESMIDAVGALSGCGPAFAYLIIEALSDGAVKMGLHRAMATSFAAHTVLGAAKMVLETNKHMGVLKDEVCSAGGTTIAGVHALEKKGVRGALMDAVETAANRAKEMSKEKH